MRLKSNGSSPDRRSTTVALEPFDPFVRASEVEKILMNGSRRAYLLEYQDPKKLGMHYSTAEVADRLLNIARKKGLNLFRGSGAGSVLGRRSMDHLVEVILRHWIWRPRTQAWRRLK